MDDITCVKGSITENEKHHYLNWIQHGTIPIDGINFPQDQHHFYPDDKYVWKSIFDNVTNKLLEYLPNKDSYSVPDFISIVDNYYNILDNKSANIPRLNKKSYKYHNLKDFDEILINCPKDRQLMLHVFRKGLKSRFKQLNFNILTFNDICQLSHYDNQDVLPYCSYYNVTSEEAEYLLQHFDKCNDKILNMMWQDPNNHYIEVNRFQKSVRPLTIGGVLQERMKHMKGDMKITINLFVMADEPIKTINDLKQKFDGMVFKRFQPACDLEETILSYCNSYAKYARNKPSYCTYREIKHIVSYSFRYHSCNLALKVLQYSKINPSFRKKTLPTKM